jgi:RimJ/RimL family protein N-acetyltransferase
MQPIAHPLLLDLPSELRTSRLVLRTFVPGDGAALFAALDANRSYLSEWLPWLGQYTQAEHSEQYCRRMTAHWTLRTDLVFGCWLPTADGELYLGAGGLHQLDWSVPSAMLGYYLCQPYVGRGYMAEAAQAIIEFGFTHCQLSRIWASCDSRNQRSLRVMERIGMAREAVLHANARDSEGKLRDTVTYVLFNESNQALTRSGDPS